MLTLVIANKCYSSWSLRPWLLLRELGVPFEEILVPFAEPIEAPAWRERIRAYSPAGKVPVLLDGEVAVWESLAILEHVAELHPDRGVWPADRAARAVARSIAAEMHAGFGALRAACPMNLGKLYAARDRGPAVARDVARVTEIWSTTRERFGAGGPFLFGAFSAADAMFAPMASRFATYALPADPISVVYVDAIIATAGFQAWRRAALAEPWVVPEDEVDEAATRDLRA